MTSLLLYLTFTLLLLNYYFNSMEFEELFHLLEMDMHY